MVLIEVISKFTHVKQVSSLFRCIYSTFWYRTVEESQYRREFAECYCNDYHLAETNLVLNNQH